MIWMRQEAPSKVEPFNPDQNRMESELNELELLEDDEEDIEYLLALNVVLACNDVTLDAVANLKAANKIAEKAEATVTKLENKKEHNKATQDRWMQIERKLRKDYNVKPYLLTIMVEQWRAMSAGS